MVVPKGGKKRPAATKLESKPKRRSSEKEIPSVTPKSTEKKRSRPITHAFPVIEEPDSDLEEDGSENWEDVDGEEDGDEVMDDEPLLDEDAMDVDEGTVTAKTQKDPNAARESHKAQRALLEQRKAAKPHSTLLTDAKRVWSLARQKNIPSAERQKHVNELMDVVRGNVKEIVFKHDASRIVQTIVKYGRQKERDEIALELKGKYNDLVQNKYSKFLVSKLIRICPAHRASILQEFQSHVLRLLLHREASPVLADVFELHANAYERTFLLRDFYGKEALLFGMTKGSAEDKDSAKKGLAGLLEGANDERQKRTLAAVKENLMLVFNNPDKGAVTHAVVHRVLWEYLTAVNTIPDEAEQERLRREMFESCQELLAEMVHTKDGSRVVREFLAQGTAKDRKQILKLFKPHIERMCLDDEAQLVLFTALDVIDDTKLLAKSLISEITTSANSIYEKPQGLRVLVYLLAPRTRRHFMPAQIASLEETDNARARTSKKDPEARATEVRKFASEALLQWIAENGAKVSKEPRGCLIATEVMLYAEGDKTSATKTLLDALTATYPSLDTSSPHPIDLSWTSRMYKTLLQGGHYNKKAQVIETAGQWNASEFVTQFMNTVPQNIVVTMCTEGEKNGTFVITTLCEALVKSGDAKKDERRKLKSWFGEKERKIIQKGEGRGKDLLLEKLALL
ncbi:ARM repeat-containing protein [Macrolepiota fuliginosa MF-IS2]|uniref:ARM repeat-containing protein n=1 Tax=Macrolepiota fuliginosa MF-IS2 TaxID=1400762 RepID=A0A9P6C4M0_9AGAR|nr:ARM repeat-containing protein [Macrolepiota fuliginosa MF-IS2]